MTARDKGPNNAAWTKKHEAEAQHQKKERLKRACAETEEGTAKGSAVSAKEFEDFRKAERKAASELVKKRRRHLAILAEPKRMDIDGKRVFVDGSALEELDRRVGGASRRAAFALGRRAAASLHHRRLESRRAGGPQRDRCINVRPRALHTMFPCVREGHGSAVADGVAGASVHLHLGRLSGQTHWHSQLDAVGQPRCEETQMAVLWSVHKDCF